MRYNIIHITSEGSYVYDNELKIKRLVSKDEMFEEIFKDPIFADIN